MSKPELYTLVETKDILKISLRAVYTLINNGLLVPFNLNGKKIPGYELERFIEENHQAGRVIKTEEMDYAPKK